MEVLFELDVFVDDFIGVEGNTRNVFMLPFHGDAHGKYFNGTVLPGGVDTQRQTKDGTKTLLSARYMMEGKDVDGVDCRVFIENNSNDDGSLTPTLVTNSKALAKWESVVLSAGFQPQDGGVKITVYYEE